ncbi:NAD-dependent protein deacetylase hst2-1 [Erysiphe neolycopersici]|uniref:NAD-dependent protein deacetylase n=1 Tax=Erysiphe neolycopersici TaxID=212602 RepID=A0A420I4F4_9PEZI|nr:NAD-dependent protein deacetylase hst2-1 [Erysiphe neolycopersici]
MSSYDSSDIFELDELNKLHELSESKQFIPQGLKNLAKYVIHGRPKQFVVMTGAGISTSAGIPDFRSPETGLYANLARLELPHPEAVFDISYFRSNPVPFYALAKELQLEKCNPTISHAFIALLNKKNLLSMLYTQNIDGLERRAGLTEDKVVEAHGSFASQSCIDCKTQFPSELMKIAIDTGNVPHCLVPQCNGLVKPDIVFFGEPLPESFLLSRSLIRQADLILVMGTSLTVYPFASLPGEAEVGIPRLLVNNEIAGDFGSRPEDVIVLGDCDEGILKFAEALGWKLDLEQLLLEINQKYKLKEAANSPQNHIEMTSDEKLESDILKLTVEVDKSLKVSREFIDKITQQL